MNTHLYRIFKKVIAIVLALLLISTDTLQYAYATVDEYQGQEVISQDVSSQENIDNNEQTSDDQNEGIIDDKNLDKNSNITEAELSSEKDNIQNNINKEDTSNEKSTENEKTEKNNIKNVKSEEVNQELVIKVGQESNITDRNISIPTGQVTRVHVTSTGSNSNIIGDYKIRLEIDNPDVILSDFQKSDGTIQNEITLDGIKLKLVNGQGGKRYIITELTQGSTNQFDFQMIFKNGVTNDGEKVIIKTEILDSNDNIITDKVADEKCIISDFTITAKSSFSWDNISKTANKQTIDRNNNGSIKDESIVYNIKATSNNKGYVGEIFTKEYTVTDELELPSSINLPKGEINSSNGQIIQFDYDMEYNYIPNNNTTNYQSNVNTTANISVERAKEIALSHAGLSADQVTFVKVNMDFDDGIQKYEIEFYYNYREYSYEIDANTGNILSYEQD